MPRGQKNNSYMLINKINHKKCNKCEEWLPCDEDHFHRNKSNKTDGLYPCCKPCNREKSLKNRHDNMDRVKDTYQKWYQENGQRKKDEVREYYQDNKEAKSEYMMEYRGLNKDKWIGYNLKRKNKNHIVSDQEWINCKEYFNNQCAYCGLHLSEHFSKYAGKFKRTDFHREHVEHDGSVYLDNCVPSCKSCNSRKNTRLLEDWYSASNKYIVFYSSERLHRIYKWLNEDYLLYFEGYRDAK